MKFIIDINSIGKKNNQILIIRAFGIFKFAEPLGSFEFKMSRPSDEAEREFLNSSQKFPEIIQQIYFNISYLHNNKTF